MHWDEQHNHWERMHANCKCNFFKIYESATMSKTKSEKVLAHCWSIKNNIMNITVPQVLPVYISLVYLLIDKKLNAFWLLLHFQNTSYFVLFDADAWPIADDRIKITLKCTKIVIIKARNLLARRAYFNYSTYDKETKKMRGEQGEQRPGAHG